MTNWTRFPARWGFHHWIIASRVKGLAFQEPPDRQEQSFSRAKPLDGFQGVGRARGHKAAGGKGQRGEEIAIKSNATKEDSSQHQKVAGAIALSIILSVLLRLAKNSNRQRPL
jgi:hypothetical protein